MLHSESILFNVDFLNISNDGELANNFGLSANHLVVFSDNLSN